MEVNQFEGPSCMIIGEYHFKDTSLHAAIIKDAWLSHLLSVLNNGLMIVVGCVAFLLVVVRGSWPHMDETVGFFLVVRIFLEAY